MMGLFVRHCFASPTAKIFPRLVGLSRSYPIISLDTHPAFSHTLPLKKYRDKQDSER